MCRVCVRVLTAGEISYSEEEVVPTRSEGTEVFLL